MAWLTDNFWWLLALIVVVFSIVVTRRPEMGKYRIRLIISLLILEGWFYLAANATSIIELLLIGIMGVALMRVCMPALSHIIAQKMADKATDAMFGEREPAPPAMDRKCVTEWRKKRRSEEAVLHLRTVLEKSPHDFESRFLLAEIYVEDMRDFPSAEREIQVIQKSQDISPSSQALAVQRLKLWREAFDGGARELEALRSVGPVKPTVVELPTREATPPPVPTISVLEPILIASHGSVNELCQMGQYGSAMGMIDKLLSEKPDDLGSWAIKARIYVQYLGQPAQADKALRRIMDADDIKPEHVDAIERLAELFVRDKEHAMKAGRLWRKLTESPSVPVEQKVVMLARLRRWQSSISS